MVIGSTKTVTVEEYCGIIYCKYITAATITNTRVVINQVNLDLKISHNSEILIPSSFILLSKSTISSYLIPNKSNVPFIIANDEAIIATIDAIVVTSVLNVSSSA